MKIIYLLSVFYLMVSFLLLKKSNKKESIIASIIYSVVLFFCYNTVIVCLYSFFKIDGSLMVLSLFNYGIGSILNFVSIKRKEIQKYVINKKELIFCFGLILITLLIGVIYFRGFTSISYESGDPAVHYRSSIHFARELEILNVDNCKDFVYDSFSNFIPIYYINFGLVLNVFNMIKSYTLFNIYNVICLMVSSLLFFITINKVLEKREKNYFYSFILTLIYSLGFPLNNMVFGFCYLGMGVVVINLLFLTIYNIKDFNKDILFKLIILFIIIFSVFFSYYLFMPCVYLALGLYYIYLWKKKEITFNRLLIYGVVTLIVPFIMGVGHFILPSFLESNDGNIFTYVNLYGHIYDNVTPIYLFFVVSVVLIYRHVKNKEKMDYFKFNLYCISGYILLFIILFILKVSKLYYFYKLFYLYWFFAIILLGMLLIKFKKYLYVVFCLILVGISLVCLCNDSMFTRILIRSNIFNYNTRTFFEDNVVLNKKELDIMENSILYKDICEYDNEFLITGNNLKNLWFYSYTESVPVFDFKSAKGLRLYKYNITFNYWKDNLKYRPCIIYFYEDNKVDYDEEDYEILFSNEEGAIVKRLGNK